MLPNAKINEIRQWSLIDKEKLHDAQMINISKMNDIFINEELVNLNLFNTRF